LMALRTFPPLVFGKGHAYSTSYTGSGTEESVGQMTREDLVKFRDTWFRPNNATLVIAGDTTLAEITPKLDQLLAGWPKGSVPQKKVGNVEVAAHQEVYLIDKPGALQSVILAGSVAPPKSDPRDIAIEMVNSIFGGEFGARLNMNLREDKHWSYGVQSLDIENSGPSLFLAFAPVQTDKTKESMTELSKEFHAIVGDKPITEQELEKAKVNQTLKMPGQFETLGAVSGAMGEIARFGLSDNYFQTYPDKVRALERSAVDDAAKSFIRPDRLIWVVVGDRAKIEAGVRELGFGDFHVIDSDGNPVN